jgi:hypothetical protein
VDFGTSLRVLWYYLFIWRPENPGLSAATKWVKHRILLKQVNPANGQDRQVLDKLHDSEGLYDPLSLYYQDFRHRDENGQPGDDRYVRTCPGSA